MHARTKWNERNSESASDTSPVRMAPIQDVTGSGNPTNLWLTSVLSVVIFLAAILVVFLCIRKGRRKASETGSLSPGRKTSSPESLTPLPPLLSTPPIKGPEKVDSKGEDYFVQLMAATKVKSISGYKK